MKSRQHIGHQVMGESSGKIKTLHAEEINCVFLNFRPCDKSNSFNLMVSYQTLATLFKIGNRPYNKMARPEI